MADLPAVSSWDAVVVCGVMTMLQLLLVAVLVALLVLRVRALEGRQAELLRRVVDDLDSVDADTDQLFRDQVALPAQWRREFAAYLADWHDAYDYTPMGDVDHTGFDEGIAELDAWTTAQPLAIEAGGTVLDRLETSTPIFADVQARRHNGHRTASQVGWPP